MWIFKYVENLPWFLGVIITVLTLVTFTLIGALFVRKAVSAKTLRAHHDVAGVVFANLGVLYAVLLGFTVVNVQQRFNKIKDITEMEASYLSDLYRDAEVFSEKHKQEIREAIKAYIQDVLEDEWNLMSKGKVSLKASESLHRVWDAYYAIMPSDLREQAWYSESISKLNSLMNARLSRLLGVDESLGPEMWGLLIVGGLVMITFIWFFFVESLASHLLMATLLAASIAFLLFLIYSLDTAFTGDIKLTPSALKEVYKTL